MGREALQVLQAPVDRFGRSLGVPSKLFALHPRRPGNPGKWAALSPAITQGVLASFEAFAEDFLATALHLHGDGYAQIAKKIGRWNNPTLRDFASAVVKEFPGTEDLIGNGFSIDIFRPPKPGPGGWWNHTGRSWSESLDDADAWMQVRHCLAHGLASGWRSERWPGPLGRGPSAVSVLRAMGNGQYSLALHGALSCARIYIRGARHIADAVATSLGTELDWSRLPSDLTADIYSDRVRK